MMEFNRCTCTEFREFLRVPAAVSCPQDGAKNFKLVHSEYTTNSLLVLTLRQFRHISEYAKHSRREVSRNYFLSYYLSLKRAANAGNGQKLSTNRIMSTYGSDSIQLKIEIHSPEMMRRDFNPANHDLDSSFRLTRFADLKGEHFALVC